MMGMNIQSYCFNKHFLWKYSSGIAKKNHTFHAVAMKNRVIYFKNFSCKTFMQKPKYQ